jgi:hypothetical protein
MAPARTLHDVRAGLAGDAGAQSGGAADRLGDAGHPDLPDGLVAEAIVSYADTATAEVAEHLAPFVQAHSAVPLDQPGIAAPDPAAGLDLLATAPVGPPVDAPAPAGEAGAGDAVVEEGGEGALEAAEFGTGAFSAATDPFGLDFGGGGQPGEAAGQAAMPAGTPEPEPVSGLGWEPAEPSVPYPGPIEPETAEEGGGAEDVLPAPGGPEPAAETGPADQPEPNGSG